MAGIAELIKQVQDEYGNASLHKMGKLFKLIGVELNTEIPGGLKIAFGEAWSKGYILRNAQYSDEEKVGQLLILRDTKDMFVAGYEVWIDFKDGYKLKTREIEKGDLEYDARDSGNGVLQ